MKAYWVKIIGSLVLVALVVVLAVVFLLRPRPSSQNAEPGRLADTQTAEPVAQPEPNDPAYLAMKEKAEGLRQEILDRYGDNPSAERAAEVLGKLPQRYNTRAARQGTEQPALPSPVTLNEVHFPQPGDEFGLPPGLPDYVYERYGLRGPAATSVSPGMQPVDTSSEMLQKLPDRYKKLLQDETGQINLDHIRKLSAEQTAASKPPPDAGEQAQYRSLDGNEPPRHR